MILSKKTRVRWKENYKRGDREVWEEIWRGNEGTNGGFCEIKGSIREFDWNVDSIGSIGVY